MTTFIQLHLLTSYPPANLNRDDLGRPKTAVMGGFQRLRISSQSLKRAWRMSDLFFDRDELEKEMGTRTKRFGIEWIFPRLLEKKVPEDHATKWTLDIQRVFGEPEDEGFINKQLAHITPLEKQGIHKIVEDLASFLNRQSNQSYLIKIQDLQKERDKKKKSEERKKITKKITGLLEKAIINSGKTAVDIALFGRMLASSPKLNIEAACQVAHAISVHKVAVEDDYFTAVDDLSRGEEDMGAAHIGETEFGAGLFYLYICINRDLLLNNIQNDEKLAVKTLLALTEAAATIAPTGKQNSFASRAYASYILAEKGRKQPRSLSVAFLKPVTGTDMLSDTVASLESTLNNINKVYGSTSEDKYQVNTAKGEGTFKELLEFVASPLPQNNDKEG